MFWKHEFKFPSSTWTSGHWVVFLYPCTRLGYRNRGFPEIAPKWKLQIHWELLCWVKDTNNWRRYSPSCFILCIHHMARDTHTRSWPCATFTSQKYSIAHPITHACTYTYTHICPHTHHIFRQSCYTKFFSPNILPLDLIMIYTS